MKRTLILSALFLSACLQQIPAGWTPQPTVEFIPTNTPIPPAPTETPTPILPTPTLYVGFPPAAPLPPGPLDMIALGDSLTSGDGDETRRGYPGRVLAMVNAVRPNSSLANFGQSGWNSDALIHGDQGLPSQLERALAEIEFSHKRRRNPVAFVWVGSNDLWYLYEFGGDVTAEAEELDAAHFSANLDVILQSLRGADAQVIISLLDDQSKRPVALNGEAFTAITPDELNRMPAQVQRYNEIILQKAEQYGTLTVDIYSSDIFTDPANLSDDGNHPNPAGYDLLAAKWFEVLSQIMKQ